MKSIGRLVILGVWFLVLWQVIIWITHTPEFILPSPLAVYKVFVYQYRVLFFESLPTVYEAVGGFLLGAWFGISTAVAMILVKRIRYWIFPLLLVSQAIPTFALAPLFMLWLGYGVVSKIAICTLIVFFPVVSSFYDGLSRLSGELESLGRVMQARPIRFFFLVRFPAALPSLGSGLRVSATYAPMGAVIGEWIGSTRGLGFVMINANAQLDIPLLYGAIITLMGLTLLFYFGVDILFKKIVWW